jgi:glycosyltransferase involved in cell wall biosynthesis
LKFIPDDDIQAYMNAADIVVLPYKNLLTSGAAMLAMSFGKPIIAPNVKCIADTLDNEGSFLYSNENSLSGALQNVLEKDRIALQNMGIHNLRLAEQFGWDEIAKKTYGVYNGHINK